ncbi:MAG: PaaI family thioesterase, partial [Mycobacteriales bacterium]
MDVPQLLHAAGGFVGTLGPRVLSSSRDGALLRLDAGPELHNHLGGPHAAAIFGLGETAAFAVLLEVFGDLV